jgi:hypothetical protein
MRGSATELTLAKEERTPRVVEQLDHLDLCRNYIRAFGEAIGLPLIWVSSEEVHESSHKTPHINPFRKWMARHHGVCENCLYSPLNQLTPEGLKPRTEYAVMLAVAPLTDAASVPAWSSLLTSMGNL